MARKKKPSSSDEEGGVVVDTLDEEIEEILDTMGGSIRSKKGKDDVDFGAVGRFSDKGLSIHLPGVIPTGSEWIDLALGRGGIPLSRFTLLYGGEGSGKTTLCLHLAAAVQREKGIVVWNEGEEKLDLDYAISLGVDPDRMIVQQPFHLEEMFESITDMLRVVVRRNSRRPILVVTDSLNTIPSKRETEGKATPGNHAAAVSQGLRGLRSWVSKAHVAFVMVSQERDKIGVSYGDKITTAGGNAPRFYSAVVMQMRAISGVKEGGDRVGVLAEVIVHKNQVAPPFKKAQYVIRYGEGFDYAHGLMGALEQTGILTKSGSWSTIEIDGEERKFQGTSGLNELILADPGIRKVIRDLRARYGW